MQRLTLPSSLGHQVRNSDYRLLITGAGGWVGMALLELLEDCLGSALHDRVACFGSSNRTLRLRSGTSILQHPLSALCDLPPRPSLLFHLAFLTKDKAEELSQDSYIAANQSISQLVVGELERLGVAGAMVASSGAAHFVDDPTRSPALRLYGRLKRDEEELFSVWSQQHQRTAVIARLFNLSGPYINKHSNYALASFILDALAGRPISVRAPRAVVRGYVSIRDLIALALGLMLQDDKSLFQFDTGGTPLELEEVARKVAGLLGPVPVNRAAIADTQPDIYVGDPGVWNSLLAATGIDATPLSMQIRSTAEFLEEHSATVSAQTG